MNKERAKKAKFEEGEGWARVTEDTVGALKKWLVLERGQMADV